MSRAEDVTPPRADLDAEQERELELLLRHAVAPAEIDPARHERLLQVALVNPFAEASEEERAESERLRRALAGEGDHPHSDLARALAAAYRVPAGPPPPAPRMPAARAPARVRQLWARSAPILASLALAAAAVFWLVRPDSGRGGAAGALPTDLPALALAQSRSTAPLFVGVEPGAASSRIDRIASARARDLRDNRYAAWGVR